MKKDVFRFVEKCLHDYNANLSRISVLQDDIRLLRMGGDIHGQSYETIVSNGKLSDPVSKHVEKLERLEKEVSRLKRLTTPITKLIDDLKKSRSQKFSEYLSIITLFYFKSFTISDIALEIKKSPRTVSTRRRELVMLAARYLGI